jgi:nitroimidazol reductase NimA-like FMN-containing flavoprotein (pyridoxamine 5'-phosphate oxidase superfamily)
MGADDAEDRGRASTTMDVLTRDECLALLAAHSVGRIAVIAHDSMPFVVPVNYEMNGEIIVFRTDEGTKLDALQRHPVAFQIDSIDPVQQTGWSVLVQGVAHVTPKHELGSSRVEPWTGPKPHWIQLVPRSITGRRLRLSNSPYEPGGYL